MIGFDRHHIRTRLALSFVSVLAFVLVVYLAAAGWLLLRDLRRQLVHHAIQDLETVEGLLYFTPKGRLLLREDYHNHPESRQVLERLLEVRSVDGGVLFRNEMLGTRSLGDRLIPNEGEGGYSAREFTLSDGSKVELVSRRHIIDGRSTVIRVAYSEAPLWRQFQSDLFALLLPLPAVLLVAGFGGYLLASRYLRPIQQMARNAEQITGDLLHERLPVRATDGELADLARVFNRTLVRLEQSFEQLRRFTSDASHELRTPLAAMRSVGEVGLQKNGSVEAYRDVIGSMLEEANKLTRLVDNLLVIARADSGHIQLSTSIFPASDLVRECTSLFEVLLEENAQELRVEAVGDPQICGDWLLLRQALVNVVHNAIKYTPPGGRITIRFATVGTDVILSVEDTGPGIPKSDLERVFDRFYRVEQSRSREAGGTGLGLSIAKWNIELHGGRVKVESEPGKGSVFSIILPSALQSSDSATSQMGAAERVALDVK